LFSVLRFVKIILLNEYGMVWYGILYVYCEASIASLVIMCKQNFRKGGVARIT